jgi:hypothetical protein
MTRQGDSRTASNAAFVAALLAWYWAFGLAGWLLIAVGFFDASLFDIWTTIVVAPLQLVGVALLTRYVRRWPAVQRLGAFVLFPVASLITIGMANGWTVTQAFANSPVPSDVGIVASMERITRLRDSFDRIVFTDGRVFDLDYNYWHDRSPCCDTKPGALLILG